MDDFLREQASYGVLPFIANAGAQLSMYTAVVTALAQKHN